MNQSMNQTQNTSFSLIARMLHWLMAIGILSMLFIGVGMVTSVSEKHNWLLAVHKPLGALLLLLVCLRLIVRMIKGTPPLPADLPWWQKRAALASHWLLYLLMFTMPLIGWAMVSASGTPVTLAGGWTLPPIAPDNANVFAMLRSTHRYLAYLLFATVLLHLAAGLFHGLIRRDGVLESMTRNRA